MSAQLTMARARSSEMRSRRARCKRDLKAGRVTLAETLDAADAAAITVYELLDAQHGWARPAVIRALDRTGVLLGAPIPENKTVGSLTDRQKQALLEACGHQSERSAA